MSLMIPDNKANTNESSDEEEHFNMCMIIIVFPDKPMFNCNYLKY